MKKIIFLAALLVCPIALAAGPGANCPPATVLSAVNIVDGGSTYCDGGNFCDGGISQQYFEAVCNLNNPIALAADPVHPNLYYATKGTADGGAYNDGAIVSIPIDGGALQPLSPVTEACPMSLYADGTNVVWVNAGTYCSYTDAGTDAGTGTGNAVLDVPFDGGTIVTLVSGYQGIRNVVSDGTRAYFTVESQNGGIKTGAVESVLLDAGAGYPITNLWSSSSGLGLVQGQLCTWVGGLMTCPGLGIVNSPVFNEVGTLAVLSNGNLLWGPAGMQMPANGSALPTALPQSYQMYIRGFAPFDAGFVDLTTAGIFNAANQPLASNAQTSYPVLATDQTTVFYPCNSQPSGAVGVCQVPGVQVQTYAVQIANEFVAASGSSSTAVSYTASSPAVKNATFLLSLTAATGSIPIAADNDAGLILATSNVTPSTFPKVLDGGIVYGTGAAFVNLSAPIPSGYNMVAQYTGQTSTRNFVAPVVLANNQAAISGMVVDLLGNLDWISPTGIDAGSLTILQPK